MKQELPKNSEKDAFKQLNRELSQLGYSDEDIYKIIGFCSEYKFETLLKHIRVTFNFFLDFGFSKREVVNLTVNYPLIFKQDIMTLAKRLKRLQKDYCIVEIKKMLKDEKALTCIRPQILDARQELIEKLGFTHEEMLKITKSFACVFRYSDEVIINKFYELLKMGYTNKQLVKMIVKSPNILGFDIDYLKSKFKNYVDLGFKYTQVIKMTVMAPQLLTLNFENNILIKFNNLIYLGFTKEQVIAMTFNYPTLLACSIDNVNEKILFYRSVGLADVPLLNSKDLMQSVDLSYARYHYLTDMGKNITEQSFTALFYGEKEFTRAFGISKERLLSNYPYRREDNAKTI